MEEYIAKSVLKKELNISNLHSGIIDALQNIVDEIPAADVQEVKHAYWYQQEEPLGWQEVDCAICSACGESYILNEDMNMDDWREWSHYCPNCGAKMDAAEKIKEEANGKV